MLGYTLLWLLTIAVCVASVPITIRMLRSSEWDNTSWPWPAWRYWPLVALPLLFSASGIATLVDRADSNGAVPLSSEDYFLVTVFLVAASLYVLLVSLYNNRQQS